MDPAADTADFYEVDRALKSLDCDIGASECHGVLCGMLCSSTDFQLGGWLAHTLGYQDEVQVGELAGSSAIATLFKQTLSGLDADDFSLVLLLPEDEYPLPTRVEALGAWCRGFLSGFGLSDVKNIKQLSEDTQGYLRDLSDIGKVNPGDLDTEGSENALFEVQEYARMGALLMREEFKIAHAMSEDGPRSLADYDSETDQSIH